MEEVISPKLDEYSIGALPGTENVGARAGK